MKSLDPFWLVALMVGFAWSSYSWAVVGLPHVGGLVI